MVTCITLFLDEFSSCPFDNGYYEVQMNITYFLKVILRYKISMKILEMMLCDIVSINPIKNSQIIFEYIRKLCGIKDIRLNCFHFTPRHTGKILGNL